MKVRRTRLQNIIIGLLCLSGRWLLMDRLFLHLGICIWIWASKHSATWHISGYIPMRCMSRQEAGIIMMAHVISVACRQFKRKTRFSPVSLHANVFVANEAQWGFTLQTFTIYHWRTKLLSTRLDLHISPELDLSIYSISRNKLMIPIASSQSLWMFFVWLVFTINLNSQSSWLNVKLKLVNLNEHVTWGQSYGLFVYQGRAIWDDSKCVRRKVLVSFLPFCQSFPIEAFSIIHALPSQTVIDFLSQWHNTTLPIYLGHYGLQYGCKKVDYPPSQPVGSGFDPHWRPTG